MPETLLDVQLALLHLEVDRVNIPVAKMKESAA
jgi:hypothetical protein